MPHSTHSTFGCSAPSEKRRARRSRSRGKTLVLVLIALPSLCGLIGLVFDGGLLFASARNVQDIADAAATAAAFEKMNGGSNNAALAIATQYVSGYNSLSSAQITFNSPPASGPYAGSSSHVELIITDQVATNIIHVLGGSSVRQVVARSVAGYQPSTAGAAITILDSMPSDFDLAPLPALPIPLTAPAITGGLEVEGLGNVQVDGAILVNTMWGGQDENGNTIGEPAGLGNLAHGVSAMPLLPLTRLRARDLRVVGGVDDRDNYQPYVSGGQSPLKAGMLPVPDPFQSLPTPTTAADPVNVKTTLRGHASVVGLPLIGPPVTLQPGVYESIQVVSGIAVFQPGVYIIRGKNPITQLSLSMVGGQVTANGVMFYITDTADFTPTSGAPDSGDSVANPPSQATANVLPSTVINIGLLGSSLRGLNDAGSPFDRMLIYQRRLDRRPIVLVQENLLGPGQFNGTVYAKWAHMILAGKGTYDARFVVGTMRIIALLDMLIQPSVPLPPAQDVYLVE